LPKIGGELVLSPKRRYVYLIGWLTPPIKATFCIYRGIYMQMCVCIYGAEMGGLAGCGVEPLARFGRCNILLRGIFRFLMCMEPYKRNGNNGVTETVFAMASASTDRDEPYFLAPVYWPALQQNASVDSAIATYEEAVTQTNLNDDRFQRALRDQAVRAELEDGVCGNRAERCATAALNAWVSGWDRKHDKISTTKSEVCGWLRSAVELVATGECKATVLALNKAFGVSKSAASVIDTLQSTNNALQREIGRVQTENARMQDDHRRALAAAKEGAAPSFIVGRNDEELAYVNQENAQLRAAMKQGEIGVAAETERLRQRSRKLEREQFELEEACAHNVKVAEMKLLHAEGKLRDVEKECSLLAANVRAFEAATSSSSPPTTTAERSAARPAAAAERRVPLGDIVGKDRSMYFELASPDAAPGKFVRVSKELAKKVRYFRLRAGKRSPKLNYGMRLCSGVFEGELRLEFTKGPLRNPDEGVMRMRYMFDGKGEDGPGVRVVDCQNDWDVKSLFERRQIGPNDIVASTTARPERDSHRPKSNQQAATRVVEERAVFSPGLYYAVPTADSENGLKRLNVVGLHNDEQEIVTLLVDEEVGPKSVEDALSMLGEYGWKVDGFRLRRSGIGQTLVLNLQDGWSIGPETNVPYGVYAETALTDGSFTYHEINNVAGGNIYKGSMDFEVTSRGRGGGENSRRHGMGHGGGDPRDDRQDPMRTPTWEATEGRQQHSEGARFDDGMMPHYVGGGLSAAQPRNEYQGAGQPLTWTSRGSTVGTPPRQEVGGEHGGGTAMFRASGRDDVETLEPPSLTRAVRGRDEGRRARDHHESVGSSSIRHDFMDSRRPHERIRHEDRSSSTRRDNASRDLASMHTAESGGHRRNASTTTTRGHSGLSARADTTTNRSSRDEAPTTFEDYVSLCPRHRLRVLGRVEARRGCQRDWLQVPRPLDGAHKIVPR
jgi:hypothetical protein